jgi:hypothetical protein
MKKIIIIFFILISSTHFSQNTKVLLAADSAVWFGLDFTKAKFTGSFAQSFGIAPNDGTELIEKWVPEWNNMFFKEPQNFDIGEAIKKPMLYRDIGAVTKLNSKINKDSVYSAMPVAYKIPSPDITIPEMIKKYSSSKKAGLGCVLIVESFNKEAHNAYVFFVLFDISNYKMIGYKRLIGIPKGIGLRNFWAGAIKDLIKQVKNSAYPSVVWNATKPK